jgi:hypothetical protein
VVRQPFDLVCHPVACQRLEGRNNVRMQRPPPLLEEPPVGDLVRKGVLEGVHALRKEAGLIQEFRRLEVRQAALQSSVGQLGNGL